VAQYLPSFRADVLVSVRFVDDDQVEPAFHHRIFNDVEPVVVTDHKLCIALNGFDPLLFGITVRNRTCPMGCKLK